MPLANYIVKYLMLPYGFYTFACSKINGRKEASSKFATPSKLSETPVNDGGMESGFLSAP